MRILLTGAAGLIGNAVLEEALRRGHTVLALYRTHAPFSRLSVSSLHVDLSNPDSAVSPILNYFPDAIINATGVTNPSGCDAFPALAESLNVLLPKKLSQIAAHLNAKLIHLSTDNVFDGRKNEAYVSSDTPNPLNYYGQTKLMAEKEVLKHGGYNAVVLRLPLVMGNSPSGKRSAHEKILGTLLDGKPCLQYTDSLRQTVSASNAAQAVIELCERPSLHGLFHWSGTETLTRYEIAVRIIEHFGLSSRKIEPVSVNDPTYPKDLVLNSTLLFGKLNTRPTDFAQQLSELKIPQGFDVQSLEKLK